MVGGVVCRMHGGSAPQVRRKAAERLAMAADDAISHMVRVMQDETLEPALRLKAALAIADRTGFVPGLHVEHSIGPTFDERMEEVEAALTEDPQLQRVKARAAGELPTAAPLALAAGTRGVDFFQDDHEVVEAELVPDESYRDPDSTPPTHTPGPPTGPRVRSARVQR